MKNGSWKNCIRRKSVIAISFSFLLILYPLCLQRRPHGLDTSSHIEQFNPRKGKIIFILTNQRSGSTFFGEFFNRNKKAFYLFEPLLPFVPTCGGSESKQLQLLKNISQCNFESSREAYDFAYTSKNYTSKPASLCGRQGVCFPDKIEPALNRYAELCYSKSSDQLGKYSGDIQKHRFSPTSPVCGFPLDTNLWSQTCRPADIVAFKIIRVCSLASFENVITELTKSGNEVHVIDLVRDPRAIISSALKLDLPAKKLDKRVELLCDRLRRNLNYAVGNITGASYMRVRYEDIASNPIRGAEKIYNHLEIELPLEVKEWIEESSIDPMLKINRLRLLIDNPATEEEERILAKFELSKLLSAVKDPYGTVRNSEETINKWRKTLSMDIIHRVQEICGDVMERLGYKLIQSFEGRNDLSMQLW